MDTDLYDYTMSFKMWTKIFFNQINDAKHLHSYNYNILHACNTGHKSYIWQEKSLISEVHGFITGGQFSCNEVK